MFKYYERILENKGSLIHRWFPAIRISWSVCENFGRVILFKNFNSKYINSHYWKNSLNSDQWLGLYLLNNVFPSTVLFTLASIVYLLLGKVKEQLFLHHPCLRTHRHARARASTHLIWDILFNKTYSHFQLTKNDVSRNYLATSSIILVYVAWTQRCKLWSRIALNILLPILKNSFYLVYCFGNINEMFYMKYKINIQHISLCLNTFNITKWIEIVQIN